MPFIVVGLIAWMITKAVADGRLDHTYAKQGLVSPRLEAKYRTPQAAQEATAGYGLFGHIRAAWLDYWPRRTQALIAAREAKAADSGEPVRWRDRWAAATRTVVTAGRKLVEPVPSRAERRPAEVVEEKPAEPAPALAVDTGDVPAGTIRHTDAGREQWTGNEWVSAPKPSPRPRKVGERWTDKVSGRVMEWDGGAWAPVCSGCDVPMGAYDNNGRLTCGTCGRAAVDDKPTATTAVDTAAATGETMSGVEASTFETAVPALGALARAAQELAEHVAGAKAAAAQFNDQVEEIDATRRAVESAAQSVVEQFEAKNLDASTMTSVVTAMEMVKAGDLSGAMDHIDAAVAKLAGAEAAAQEASGAAAQAGQTVESKYGDAHNTVASELGGDASFLHSGGGAGGGSTATPAAGSSGGGESGGGIHVTDGDISFTGAIGGSGGGSLAGVGASKPSGGPTNSGVQHFGTGEINFGSGSAVGDGASVSNG